MRYRTMFDWRHRQSRLLFQLEFSSFEEEKVCSSRILENSYRLSNRLCKLYSETPTTIFLKALYFAIFFPLRSQRTVSIGKWLSLQLNQDFGRTSSARICIQEMSTAALPWICAFTYDVAKVFLKSFATAISRDFRNYIFTIYVISFFYIDEVSIF